MQEIEYDVLSSFVKFLADNSSQILMDSLVDTSHQLSIGMDSQLSSRKSTRVCK